MKTYTDKHGRVWKKNRDTWLHKAGGIWPCFDVWRHANGTFAWVNVNLDGALGFETAEAAMDAAGREQ